MVRVALRRILSRPHLKYPVLKKPSVHCPGRDDQGNGISVDPNGTPPPNNGRLSDFYTMYYILICSDVSEASTAFIFRVNLLNFVQVDAAVTEIIKTYPYGRGVDESWRIRATEWRRDKNFKYAPGGLHPLVGRMLWGFVTFRSSQFRHFYTSADVKMDDAGCSATWQMVLHERRP